MSSRSGRSYSVAVVTGLLACLVPAAASAQAPTVTFHFRALDEFLNLEGPANTTVNVQDRASNGELRGAGQAHLDGSGHADVFFNQKVLPGDTLLATWGVSDSRSIVVPPSASWWTGCTTSLAARLHRTPPSRSRSTRRTPSPRPRTSI